MSWTVVWKCVKIFRILMQKEERYFMFYLCLLFSNRSILKHYFLVRGVFFFFLCQFEVCYIFLTSNWCMSRQQFVRFIFPLEHSSWRNGFETIWKYSKEDGTQVLDSLREKTDHSIIMFLPPLKMSIIILMTLQSYLKP